MKYLLDTCVISDFVKGDASTLRHIHLSSPQHIVVSTISSMEIHYGLSLNPDRARKIQGVLQDFFSVIQLVSFDHSDELCAANIRSALKIQGAPIGSYDVLLAGTAINRNLVLVSSNLREFERIKGLRCENWRESCY